MLVICLNVLYLFVLEYWNDEISYINSFSCFTISKVCISIILLCYMVVNSCYRDVKILEVNQIITIFAS